jgi:hypothetical protein
MLITENICVFCVTYSLKPQKLQPVESSQQTWMPSRVLVFCVSVRWTVSLSCRRNRLVFAQCRNDLMLWHVFKLQWPCVMCGPFFFSFPNPFPPLPHVLPFEWSQSTNMAACDVLEGTEWRWLCSTSQEENGGVPWVLWNIDAISSIYFLIQEIGLQYLNIVIFSLFMLSLCYYTQCP